MTNVPPRSAGRKVSTHRQVGETTRRVNFWGHFSGSRGIRLTPAVVHLQTSMRLLLGLRHLVTATVAVILVVAGGAHADAECTDPSHTLTMHDTYGDGWNDAMWTWTSADGDVVGSGTLKDGGSGTVAICDDSTDGCATLSVSEGGYPDEISWNVSNANGVLLVSGKGGTTAVCVEVGPTSSPTTSCTQK